MNAKLVKIAWSVLTIVRLITFFRIDFVMN